MNIISLRNERLKSLKIPTSAGNWLFWIAFALLLITQFSQGTMFYLYYPFTSFPYRLFMISGALSLLKIILFNKFNDMKEFVIYLTIGLIILSSCQNADDWNLIYYYLIILAAQGIDFNRVVKFFLVTVSFGILVTFIYAKLGIIIDLTNNRSNDSGVRFALGMVYPTDLAARAFYLQLFYVVYRKFKLTIPEFISCFAFTSIIYIFTDTRLDLILMILTLICAAFYKQIIFILDTIKSKYISIISILSIVLIIILNYLYTPNNLVFKIFNKLLSGRLEYGHEAFVRYNVTLFGQYVQQNGNGSIHKGWFDYFFIDCSFLRILIMNGFVLFITILIVLSHLSKKFIQNKYYSLEIALILIIISSLIDQHLTEISFNLLFLTLESNLNFFQETNIESV